MALDDLACSPNTERSGKLFERRETVGKSIEEALKTEYLTDVEFIVGNGKQSERFKAHKLILSFGSPVFNVMFNGSLPEKNEVFIEDISPVAFKSFLKYLYSEKPLLELESWKLEVHDLISVLHAARKYDIAILEEVICESLENIITIQSLVVILNASKLYDVKKLENKAWEYLDLEADAFICKDETFLQLSAANMSEIIQRDSLSISEIKLFGGVVRWAEEQCLQRNLEKTPGNMRLVLDNVINLVRFPTMEATEFADGPAQTGILLAEEIIEILMYICASPSYKPQTRFPTHKRSYKNPHVYCSCVSMNYSANGYGDRRTKKQCQFCSEPFFSSICSPKKSKFIMATATPPRYCPCRARGYCPSVGHLSKKFQPYIPH